MLVTPGAAAALFIVHTTLLGPGDELVVVRPNYATNLETPRAIGAAVRHLDLDYEDGWAVDPDRIAALMTPKTVLVSLTTPHNPTGQVMTEADLRAVVRLVEAHPRARLLVDETYREMTFGGPLPLAASLSERVIGVSSLSKADGLPGHPDRLADHHATRTSRVDSSPPRSRSSSRTRSSTRRSPRSPWPAGRSGCRSIRGRASRPRSRRSGTGSPTRTCSSGSNRAAASSASRASGPAIQVDVDAFYRILLERHGTLVGPGHWFDQPRRHFRLGYGWPTAVELEQGLAALLASAVEAWDGPRVRSDRRPGAAIGNALLEMDRQIFRDVPRVEEMVKTGSETVGLSGDGGLVVRLPTSEPAADTDPDDQPASESPTDSGPLRALTGQATARAGVSTGAATASSSTAMSMSSAISLPTSQLPASSATFQLRPHASRSTLALRWNPACRPPRIPGTIPLNSASNVTGWVTSRIVTSAVTR